MNNIVLPFETRKSFTKKMEDYLEEDMVNRRLSSINNVNMIQEGKKSSKKLIGNLTEIKNQQIDDILLNNTKQTIKGMINAIIDFRNQGNQIEQIENKMIKGEFKIINSKSKNPNEENKINNISNFSYKRLSYNNSLDANHFYKKIKKLVVSPRRNSYQNNPIKNKFAFNYGTSNKRSNKKINTLEKKGKIKNKKLLKTDIIKPNENKYKKLITFLDDNNLILLKKKKLKKKYDSNIISSNKLISNILNEEKSSPKSINLSNKQTLANRIFLGSEHLIQKNLEREYQLKAFRELNYRKLITLKGVYDSLSESEDELDEPTFIIHPESIFFLRWKFILFLIIGYNIIFTPLSFAFYYKNFLFFFLGDLICDIIFFLDFIFQFFIPLINENYELNHFNIIKHYFFTWFFFDLIVDFPISTVINVKCKLKRNDYHNNVQLLHLLKLIKILKLLKQKLNSRKLIEKKISKISMLFNSTKSGRLFIFFFIFFSLNHILSCIYCFIARIHYPNWIYFYNLQDSSNISIYICAIYYNLLTIYSIGYGNIVPISLSEKIYTIFLQSIGIFIYSFLVSHMMLVLKISPKKEEYNRKLNLLNDIKIKYNLTNKLYYKIHRILDFNYEIDNKDKFQLLDYVPSNLRYELIEIMYKKMLNFKFFKNTNIDFIAKVIVNLKPLKAAFGDIIIKEDEFIDELIFVIKGKISVECFYKNKVIKISEINSGEHFGEINMFLNKKSSFDLVVKSRTAECVILSKDILFEITNEYSDILTNIQTVSMINYTLFEKKLKKRKKEIDNQLKINNKKEIKKIVKFKKKKCNNIDIIEELSNEESNDISSEKKSKNLKNKVYFIKRKKSTSEESFISNKKILSDKENKIRNKLVDGQLFESKKISATVVMKNKKKQFNRKSLIMAKNVFEGSLNINKPKEFYIIMFDKITLKEQIKKINNIYNRIKSHFL